MSENNTYFEVIQNRLDTLVDKIIQKEQTDEDFRITYAQILEKINTKMDLFSNDDTSEEIKTLSQEIGQLLQSRQEILDAKFSAIKAEFDNLNKLLFESLKTPELLAAFNKIHNQIHYLTEGQEAQKENYNALISHIENFGTLQDTNEIIVNDFAILNEQNTTLKNQIDELQQFNKEVEINNKKLLDEVSSVIFNIKELTELSKDNRDDVKTFVADRIDSLITKLQESDASLEVLNNNLNTLVEVVANIYDDEAFEELKTDVADIFKKSELISATLKELATKEDFIKNASQNKDEIKKNSLELVTQLEANIFDKLNVADITDIKNYAEKIFFQGTEVLKEEIWSVKDTVKNIDETVVKSDVFDKSIQAVKDDIIDVISEESVAATNQVKELKEDLTSKITEECTATSDQIKNVVKQIDNLKEDITYIISGESVASAQQIKQLGASLESLKTDLNNLILNEQGQQIEIALQNLQTKFVTQLVQIADNISFDEQADDINDNVTLVSDEIKEELSSAVSGITEDLSTLKNNLEKLQTQTEADNKDVVSSINKLDETLKANVSDEISNLASKIKLLTNGFREDNDFSYTMPDVESDIAKIRVDLSNLQRILINPDSLTEDHSIDIATRLNDLKAAVQKMQDSPITHQVSEMQEMFTGLSEDIASISKRTNKLIISSDEVTKKLLSNISAFTNLINTFDKQSKSFYNSAFLKDINKKVDTITRGTEAIVQSNNAINEAFVYMGEWIDTASDSFDNLQNDVSKIKKTLLSDDENFTERLNIEINAVNQKLEEQQKLINSIVQQQTENQELNQELKSLLEFVASQVSITNEKMIENEQLTQKILNMEKQLKKIEKNIAIITEYIDDDDNYDE